MIEDYGGVFINFKWEVEFNVIYWYFYGSYFNFFILDEFEFSGELFYER